MIEDLGKSKQIALFLDEYFGEKDFIQELSKLKSVDILWVAPNSVSMITQYQELNGIEEFKDFELQHNMRNSNSCLLYTSPSPRDKRQSRMPSSA